MATTYVAFLRGINVGGNNLIPMPRLRTLVAELGFTDVSTYLNTGNVVLTSDLTADQVAVAIAGAVAGGFDHPVDVVVRGVDHLRRVLAANPFPEGSPSQVTVAFLVAEPDGSAPDRVGAVATEHEPYRFAGREVWVHYADGIGRSKLARDFSRVVGVSATVRNVATLTKIVAGLS